MTWILGGIQNKWNSPSSPEREVLDERNRVVALVPFWSSPNTVGRDEDEARAHLIAAAPELLEALKVMVEVVGHLVEEYPEHPAHAYVSEASTAMRAIAKAEGR